MSQSSIPNEDALSHTHFWSKFREYPLRDKFHTGLGVLRYFWRARKFNSKELVVIDRNVVLAKRGTDSQLLTGRGVRISRNCVLVVGEQGRLELGTRVIIGPNTRIMAATSVTIGARCMISWNCSIFDSIGHRMWMEGQDEAEIEAPISIGDDVWIGPYSIIMKGVTIGSNSIIGAGSVVRRNVPSGSLVFGNPARVAGKVERWER